MKLQLVVSAAILMFCSCLNKKYLAKNQVVFKVTEARKSKKEIKAFYTGNNRLQVEIQDVNGTLLLEKDSSEHRNFILPTVIANFSDTGSKYGELYLNGKYYFPETLYPLPGDSASNQLFKAPTKLKFSENHLVFQIVTIPLKVRPGVALRRLKDSIQTQALAELNLGGAFGLKRTWTSFKAHPNEEGTSTVNTSFACTGFASLGGTNVTPLTTRYSVPYEKTEFALSYGVNFLVGYYNLNLGFSIGADHLLNPTIASKWVYEGNVWYGISIAYDIIK